MRTRHSWTAPCMQTATSLLAILVPGPHVLLLLLFLLDGDESRLNSHELALSAPTSRRSPSPSLPACPHSMSGTLLASAPHAHVLAWRACCMPQSGTGLDIPGGLSRPCWAAVMCARPAAFRPPRRNRRNRHPKPLAETAARGTKNTGRLTCQDACRVFRTQGSSLRTRARYGSQPLSEDPPGVVPPARQPRAGRTAPAVGDAER